MIQRMLAIWSLVLLPFLNPAWTSASSRFTYCWSLAWRILSITLPACGMIAIVRKFEHSLALPFFGTGMKTDLFQSCGPEPTSLHLQCLCSVYQGQPNFLGLQNTEYLSHFSWHPRPHHAPPKSNSPAFSIVNLIIVCAISEMPLWSPQWCKVSCSECHQVYCSSPEHPSTYTLYLQLCIKNTNYKYTVRSLVMKQVTLKVYIPTHDELLNSYILWYL